MYRRVALRRRRPGAARRRNLLLVDARRGHGPRHGRAHHPRHGRARTPPPSGARRHCVPPEDAGPMGDRARASGRRRAHRHLRRRRARAELVRQFTFQFPAQVIGGVLGLPRGDFPQFQVWASAIISVNSAWERGHRRLRRARRSTSTGVLEERRAYPRDDLVSDLAVAELDGERLDDEEIFSFLRLLLPAGVETTFRSSGNFIYALLTHPDQLDALRLDRSLMPQAIEEALRWEPPLLITSRVVTRDTELRGTPVPAGANVTVMLGAANRDPAATPIPIGSTSSVTRSSTSLRPRAAHVPGDAPGSHGDTGRGRRAARPASRPAPRPRARRPAHPRPDLPVAHRAARPLRLSHPAAPGTARFGGCLASSPSPASATTPHGVDLDDVIAPPYDVIGPDERARLEARSPWNVVRIDLSEPEEAATGTTTRATSSTSGSTPGVLVPDDEPAFYVYRMGFHDEHGPPPSDRGRDRRARALGTRGRATSCRTNARCRSPRTTGSTSCARAAPTSRPSGACRSRRG